MANLTTISQHPHNTDPTARLVSGPQYRGLDIYRVRGGFLALVDLMAFETLFPSRESAETAQRDYLKSI